MDVKHLFEFEAEHLITAAVSGTLTWFFLTFLRRAVWKMLGRWAQTTPSGWGLRLLDSLKRPIKVLVWIAALFAVMRTGLISSEPLSVFVNGAFRVIALFCGIWMIERAVKIILDANPTTMASNKSTRDLVATLARVAIFSIGLLLILENVGISITPLLASLGVGSVAIALALQDTLGNFFSGIYLLVDQPIRLGDYVRIEGDVEGHVKRIGWRSTHIQLTSNNTVVFPNSKLSSARITNYDFPTSETSLSVDFGVAYESDLTKVEKVTLDVARQTLAKVQGAVAGFEPALVFQTFGDSRIGLSVTLRAQRFTDGALIRHEFIKALIERYRQEGISIPYPQRVVHKAEQESQ